MRRSIRKQIAFTFVGLLLLVLVSNYLINNFFLEDFYLVYTWQATVRGVAESETTEGLIHTHTHAHTLIALS